MTIKLYGIPTCGMVKKARKWLDDRGINYLWVDLREQPPLPEQVARWFDAFGARALRNTSGGAYRNLPPEKKDWTDREWLAAFKTDSMLLKRPIIEADGEPVTVGFREDFYKERFGS